MVAETSFGDSEAKGFCAFEIRLRREITVVHQNDAFSEVSRQSGEFVEGRVDIAGEWRMKDRLMKDDFDAPVEEILNTLKRKASVRGICDAIVENNAESGLVECVFDGKYFAGQTKHVKGRERL